LESKKPVAGSSYIDRFCLHGIHRFVYQATTFFVLVSRRIQTFMGQHTLLGLDFSGLQPFPSLLRIHFWPIPLFLGF